MTNSKARYYNNLKTRYFNEYVGTAASDPEPTPLELMTKERDKYKRLCDKFNLLTDEHHD